MGEILLPLSPVFRTYKRGKTVKSNSYVLTLPPHPSPPPKKSRSTTQRIILLCLFLSSPWGNKYPPTKCHSLRLVIPAPVTQLASDTLQLRHVVRSCLDPALSVGEVPPWHLWVWLGMPWYSCLLGHRLLPGDPASSSCCSHPLLPVRTVF